MYCEYNSQFWDALLFKIALKICDEKNGIGEKKPRKLLFFCYSSLWFINFLIRLTVTEKTQMLSYYVNNKY